MGMAHDAHFSTKNFSEQTYRFDANILWDLFDLNQTQDTIRRMSVNPPLNAINDVRVKL